MSRKTLAQRLADALPASAPSERCKHWLAHPGSSNASPRSICVSPNQTKVLFANKTPEKIACGVFACAYKGPSDDTVTKITYDPSDVGSLLQAKGSPYVPKVKAAYRLRSRVAWKNEVKMPARMSPWAYGVVVEKLKLLPKNLDSYATCIGTKSAVHKWSLITATSFCCEDMAGDVEKEQKACRAVGNALTTIQHDLHTRGVQWKDIHGGNIGFGKDASGKPVLKALDLGMTNTAVNPKLPELAGARGRRKRRRK